MDIYYQKIDQDVKIAQPVYMVIAVHISVHMDSTGFVATPNALVQGSKFVIESRDAN